MSNKNEEGIIKMIYKIDKENKNKIKIFHFRFVDNNKGKCKILYKNEEYDLKEYFYIYDNYNDNDTFSIMLKGINKITDASYMFCEVNH